MPPELRGASFAAGHHDLGDGDGLRMRDGQERDGRAKALEVLERSPNAR